MFLQRVGGDEDGQVAVGLVQDLEDPIVEEAD